MTNEVFFSNDAAIKMKDGIDIGAKSVAVTLGYGGRTVYSKKKGHRAENTKDGVSVITSIQKLADPLQDMGLDLIKEVSTRVAYLVGDGTSTVTVLFREMVELGLKMKQAGANPMQLKKGMEKALDAIISTVDSIKKDVGNDRKLLKQIATVSANNDKEIGDYIGGIYEKLGKTASVQVEDANSPHTSVELVKGYQIDEGFYSEYFINTDKNTCELLNPYILIIDGKLEATNHVFPILEKVIAEGRSIAIIADDYSHNVAADILKNVKGKKLQAYLIKNNFTGGTKDELLFDVCAVTGATLITPKTGKKIENIDTSFLGQCEKIVSKKTETTIYNGKLNQKEVNLRIDEVNKKIATAKNTFLKEKYEFRLAKLSGTLAIYYVGGYTQTEIKEKMDRIDDALKATRAAILGGVVSGGGTALIRCIDAISELKYDNDDEKSGIRLVQKSIEKPLFQIASNCGKSGELMVEKVKEKSGNLGYNAKTDKIEDLVKAGIVDPAKVVKTCAEVAISGAAQFLISECAIIEVEN